MSDRLTVDHIREALKKVKEETGSEYFPIIRLPLNREDNK
jgi:hypothetical protein